MNCNDIRLELPDFVAGRASGEVHEGIRRHLAQCRSCQLQADSLAVVLKDLSSLTSNVPDAQYWPTILPRIHQEIERRSHGSLLAWAVRFLTPVSAAAMVFFTVTRLISLNNSTEMKTIFAQLQQDDIQGIAEEALVTGGVSVTNETEPGSVFPDDKEFLHDLFADQSFEMTSLENYGQNSVDVLSDNDVEDVIQNLHKKSLDDKE